MQLMPSDEHQNGKHVSVCRTLKKTILSMQSMCMACPCPEGAAIGDICRLFEALQSWPSMPWKLTGHQKEFAPVIQADEVSLAMLRDHTVPQHHQLICRARSVPWQQQTSLNVEVQKEAVPAAHKLAPLDPPSAPMAFDSYSDLQSMGITWG